MNNEKWVLIQDSDDFIQAISVYDNQFVAFGNAVVEIIKQYSSLETNIKLLELDGGTGLGFAIQDKKNKTIDTFYVLRVDDGEELK